MTHIHCLLDKYYDYLYHYLKPVEKDVLYFVFCSVVIIAHQCLIANSNDNISLRAWTTYPENITLKKLDKLNHIACPLKY